MGIYGFGSGFGNGYGYDRNMDEESLREEELEEAERMIRNGAGMRRIRQKQFSSLGQSDLYKLFRKYGMDPDSDSQGYF